MYQPQLTSVLAGANGMHVERGNSRACSSCCSILGEEHRCSTDHDESCNLVSFASASSSCCALARRLWAAERRAAGQGVAAAAGDAVQGAHLVPALPIAVAHHIAVARRQSAAWASVANRADASVQLHPHPVLQGCARQPHQPASANNDLRWVYMLQDSLNEALRAELARLQATAADALQQQGTPVSAGLPAGLPAGLAALGQPPAAGAAPQGGHSPALPPQPSSLGEIAAAAASRARAQAAAAAIAGAGSPAPAAPPFDLATALAAKSAAAAPASLGEQEIAAVPQYRGPDD